MTDVYGGLGLRTPYPVDGRIYDQNGSTAVNGATVVILNITSQEKISGSTDAAGDFLLDLANLTSGYLIGDRIQITAFYGDGSGRRSLSKRYTLAGTSYSAGNFVLHSGEEPFGTCHITFVSLTNSTAGGLYVDFYDRSNDVKVFRIECLGGYYADFGIGYLGKRMDGGFIRVFESNTSGELEVLTVVK